MSETWVSLSVDAIKAVRRLENRHPRSAVSRAYYAAYAAITGELVKSRRVTFANGRGNPDHGQLRKYILNAFPSLGYSIQAQKDVVRAIKNLYRDRVRADYLPTEVVNDSVSKNRMRDAERVLTILSVPVGGN